MATCPGPTCTTSATTATPSTTALSDLPSNPIELSILLPIIIIATAGGIAVLALLIWKCRSDARHQHQHQLQHQHQRRQPSQHIVSLDVANPRPHVGIPPAAYTQRSKEEPICLPPAQREKLHIRGNGRDNIEEQPGVVIIVE